MTTNSCSCIIEFKHLFNSIKVDKQITLCVDILFVILRCACNHVSIIPLYSLSYIYIDNYT
jgi:hypothetical protein